MEVKQSNNNVLANEGLAIAVILAAFYFKFKEDIQERLHDPIFICLLVVVVILLGIAFYITAHYVEKFFNEIKMRQSGIRLDDAQKVKFPFIPFDLQKELDSFYKDTNNNTQTFLGLNAEKQNKEIVSVPDIQRCQHMQVLGMIGTGKTSSVFLPLIYQDALKNRPVIIIDAKGEESFINQINGMLTRMGRADDFLLFSLAHKDKSCSYNPLYVGECDPHVISQSFLSNFKDENSYYRETAKSIFSEAFYILYSLGKPFTVMDMYAYLNDNNCRKAVNDQINDDGKAFLHLKLFSEKVISLTKQHKDWRHVIAGLNNYLLSYKEDSLNDADGDIIFTDIISQGKIVYLQLPTNSYPIEAPNIARLAQANLRYISSLVQTGKLPKNILISINIDEYGSFAEEFFVEVNNKARSSCMMITIAHQSSGDLSQVSESFQRRMEDSTLNKIYFKEGDHVHCEGIARSLGTHVTEEKTFRKTAGRFGNQIYTGESSSKIINEFNFHPDKIKNLHKYGQGYFIYRGENSPKCVNFGLFRDMPEVPYEKRAKKGKKEGLGLFEKYYIRQGHEKRLTNNADIKPEDKPDLENT